MKVLLKFIFWFSMPGVRHKILLFFFFFKILFLYFRQKGREGEREGEKHQCVVASCPPPMEDLVHNPGMCPNWELNWRHFGSQTTTQSTEPHQPGKNA